MLALLASLTYVIIVSTALVGFAVMLAVFARRTLHASGGRILSIFLATADFITDVCFAQQMADEGHHGILVCSALSLAATVIAGLAFSLHSLRICWIAERACAGSSHLDFAVLGRHPAAFAAILVLATTNLNLLILMPWRAKDYDGFPTATLLRRAQLSVLIEDLPQIVLQSIYLAMPGGEKHIAAISLLLSVLSVVYRVVRKLLAFLAVSALRPSARKQDGLSTRLSRPSKLLLEIQPHSGHPAGASDMGDGLQDGPHRVCQEVTLSTAL